MMPAVTALEAEGLPIATTPSPASTASQLIG